MKYGTDVSKPYCEKKENLLRNNLEYSLEKFFEKYKWRVCTNVYPSDSGWVDGVGSNLCWEGVPKSNRFSNKFNQAKAKQVCNSHNMCIDEIKRIILFFIQTNKQNHVKNR